MNDAINNYRNLLIEDLKRMVSEHKVEWGSFDEHLSGLREYVGKVHDEASITELAMISTGLSFTVNDLAHKTDRHPNRVHPYEGEASNDPAEFEFAVYRNAHKRLLDMLADSGLYDNTDNPKFRDFMSSGYRGAEILELEDEGMDKDTDLDKTLLAFLMELTNKIAHRDDANMSIFQQRDRAMDEDDIRWNIARYCSEDDGRIQSLRQLLDHIKSKYPHIWEQIQLVEDDLFGDQKKIMDKYLRKVIEDSGSRNVSLNRMRIGLEESYKETIENIHGMASVMSFTMKDGEITSAGSKKIYPNDPCPCGSGKKYKKCCGRKQ